ncbi:probable methyltransferase PMT2, partial [Tanacetum coccineum]
MSNVHLVTSIAQTYGSIGAKIEDLTEDELKVVPDPATWSLLEENTFTEIMDKEVKRGCLIVCEDGSEELHFGWKTVVVLKSVTDASQDNEYIAREQMMVSGTGNESVYMLAHCWRTLNSSLCRASMSFTRRDNHEAQVQFALERGVLAVIGVLAGKYMMEVDRVLRPGGYWVLSGPLIKTAKLLSWDKISKKGEMAIWQKKINTESCRPAENTPEVEYFSTDPDDVWYKKMETCITPGGSNGDVTQYKPLPEMLYGIPPRIFNSLINSGRYRDIMDMNAGLGGFAAALESLKMSKTWSKDMDKCHHHQKDIPDAIQDWIERGAAIPVDGKESSPDVCVTELGGTIGFSTKNPIEIMSQMVESGKHIQQLGEAIILLIMAKHLRAAGRSIYDLLKLFLVLPSPPANSGAYIHHKEIKGAQEIKITAQ